MSEDMGTYRVLVLSHMYPSEDFPWDGIFIHRHVKALQEAGVDVVVVSPIPWVPRILSWHTRWAGYRARRRSNEYEGVRRIWVPYIAIPSSLLWVGWLTMIVTLLALMKRIRRDWPFEIIHAHTSTPDGWVAGILGSVFGCPVICSVRGSDIHTYPVRSRMRRMLTVWALRRAATIVAVSKALAEEAEKLCGRFPEVVYNGVGEEFSQLSCEIRAESRRSMELEVTDLAVVFVGRCEEQKGLGDLLEAFAWVLNAVPNAVLIVVGSMTTAAGAMRTKACARFRERIRWIGQVLPRNMVGVLASADLFVLPSWNEGMPNALLEAMSAGLPVVATRVGGIPEVIRDGRNGLIVMPRSPRALGTAIERLLVDREAAVAMGRQAEIAMRSFTWTKNAAAHVRIYKSVAG